MRKTYGTQDSPDTSRERKSSDSLDDILMEVGYFGKFHWIQILLLWTASLISGMAIVAFVFTGKIFLKLEMLQYSKP